jgi:hypothetical protein
MTATGQKAPADAAKKDKPVETTGGGEAEKTGKREDPRPTHRVTDDFVQAVIDRLKAIEPKSKLARKKKKSDGKEPKTLYQVLLDDHKLEQKKAREKGSYANYRPLVLIIDDALTKTFETFGYDKGKKAFELKKAKPGKLFEATKTLVQGIYTKDAAIRKDFLGALRRYLDSFLIRCGIKEEEPPRTAIEVKTATAKEKEAKEKKRREEMVDAWMNIFFAMLDLMIHVWVLFAADAEQKKALEAKGTWAGKIQPFFKPMFDIIAAVLVLVTTPEGVSKLNAFAKSLKDKQGKNIFDDEEEAHDRLIEKKLGLEAKDREENKKKRKEARDKAAKDLKDKSEGKTVADEISKVLNGILGIIDNGVKAYEAYHAAFPEGLEGEYLMSGAPEGHFTWKLKLKKKDEENSEGTLEVSGFPPSATRFQAGRYTQVNHPIVTEAKATVSVLKPQGSKWVMLKWKGKKLPKATRRLPTFTDDVWAGETEHKELFQFGGNNLLFSDKSQLTWPGSTKRPIRFERERNLKGIFTFITAVWSTIGSIPKALPTDLEKKFHKLVKKHLTLNTAHLKEKSPLLKAIFDYVHVAFAGSLMSLGIKHGDDNKLIGTWDVAEIFEYHSKADAQRAAGKHLQNPYVPKKLEGGVKIPRLKGLSIAVAWEPWDPKSDPKAGTQGFEDKLKGVSEARDLWDKYLADLGCKYDLLTPVFGADSVPTLQLPLVLYLGDVTLEQKNREGKPEKITYQVNSKITFTIGMSAKIFAQLFPQLRACLFAWECGWAAGTFIREKLLQWGPYRSAEKSVQAWVGGYDMEFTTQVATVSGIGYTLAYKTRRVTGIEALIAASKSDFFVWKEVMGREGAPRRIGNVDNLKTVEALLRDRLKEVQQRNEGKLVKARLGHEYIDTEVEAKVLLYLWGDRKASVAQLRAEIDKASKPKEKGGAGELLAPRAEVLKLYLACTETRDQGKIHDLFKEARQKVEQWRDAQVPAQVPYFGFDMSVHMGQNPMRAEGDAYVQAMKNTLQWVPFLRSISFPFPEGYVQNEFKVYKHKEDKKFHWQVRTAKPHTYLKVYFWELDSGKRSGTFNDNDDYLGYWELSHSTGSKEPVRTGIYSADCTFDVNTKAGLRMAQRMRAEKEGMPNMMGRGTLDIYVRVFGKNKKLIFDSYNDLNHVYTVTVDGLGRVIKAQLRAGK